MIYLKKAIPKLTNTATKDIFFKGFGSVFSVSIANKISNNQKPFSFCGKYFSALHGSFAAKYLEDYVINNFPYSKGFINASIELVNAALKRLLQSSTVLFSFRGTNLALIILSIAVSLYLIANFQNQFLLAVKLAVKNSSAIFLGVLTMRMLDISQLGNSASVLIYFVAYMIYLFQNVKSMHLNKDDIQSFMQSNPSRAELMSFFEKALMIKNYPGKQQSWIVYCLSYPLIITLYFRANNSIFKKITGIPCELVIKSILGTAKYKEFNELISSCPNEKDLLDFIKSSKQQQIQNQKGKSAMEYITILVLWLSQNFETFARLTGVDEHVYDNIYDQINGTRTKES